MTMFSWTKQDTYVARICLGSFVVCFFFMVSLFILVDVFQNLDSYAEKIDQLPEQYRRLGTLLVGAFHLVNLPFIYLLIAPFVTATAGMFAVSRLMSANEVLPMLFTGRPLVRVLLPLWLMAVANAAVMVGLREIALPELVVAKDNLRHMIKEGEVDRVVQNRVLRLPGGEQVFFERYHLQSNVLDYIDVRVPRKDSDLVDSIRATRAEWRPNSEAGPGWALTSGRVLRPDTDEGSVLAFLSLDKVEAFTPTTINKRLKESRELVDLSYGDLKQLVTEQPHVLDYTVELHRYLTFPLANVLLLLLALPFAMRFERGSRAERIVYALVVCGAYLLGDLIAQNAGRQGLLQPVFAAWLPTVLFGSLAVVMFDTART
ncbi:MAG: hypothetical protein CMJ85_09785 [Planctomycetes bacterium]|nr:hypothetical protein [Planctomycetota bacterium]